MAISHSPRRMPPEVRKAERLTLTWLTGIKIDEDKKGAPNDTPQTMVSDMRSAPTGSGIRDVRRTRYEDDLR